MYIYFWSSWISFGGFDLWCFCLISSAGINVQSGEEVAVKLVSGGLIFCCCSLYIVFDIKFCIIVWMGYENQRSSVSVSTCMDLVAVLQ